MGATGAAWSAWMPTREGAAARFGDEPVAMAQRLGVPVWVGADRFAAGQAAEAAAAEKQEADSSASLRNDKEGAPGNDKTEAAPDDNRKAVHLLDDGFQHRGLARAMDVVVVTEEDLEDALLPAGNRREALRALRRADAVVVREEERDRVEERVRQLMRDGRAGLAAAARASLGGFGGGAGRQAEAAGVLRDCAAGGVLGDAGAGGPHAGGEGRVQRSS